MGNWLCREALGVQMPAMNIFRDRTISNVAERIRQLRMKRKHTQKTLTPINSS